MTAKPDAVVSAVLDRCGRSYAEDAGIRLADRPAPLYQLLVLATVLSARISSQVAIRAARELFAAGYTTPKAMARASWQDRVDALGRAHYKRYDERTSTMLGKEAGLLLDRWGGDLRRLRDEAGGDAKRISPLLQEFPGIGPSGADIFLREVQATWPSVAPYLDERVLKGARRIGLPDDAAALAGFAGQGKDLARLAAGLVRISLSKEAAEQVTDTVP